MYRAQILLEQRQRRKLEELARIQGRSISAVTREVIDAGLQMLEDQAENWERRSRVLATLGALREKQSAEYGGELIGEAREERDNETDEIWRNDT